MGCLSARVAAVAARNPGRIAIVEDSGRSIGYGAFWAQVQACAAMLRADGLRDGDAIAVVLPNRIESAIAYYGIWLAGGVAVALNAQAKARDIGAWLRHSGATHLLHLADDRETTEALDTLRAAGDAVPICRALGESAPWLHADLDAAQIAQTDAAYSDANAPALVLYTSGTTGAPKGVTLSHANLLANAEAIVDYLALREDDSVLSVLAFYYAYGASVLHTHLISGARVVLAENLLFPHRLMETLVRERVSGFSGVPSTYALLLDRLKLADYDLASLRYLTQAGGAMPRELLARLREALPAPALYLMYGQTEATARLCWLPPERLDDKPGSVGVPVRSVRLRIVREDGSEAAPGEDGEVCASGPNIMLGYWRDAEASARTLRAGWLHTGDIGHLDAEGFLFLAGRRSDMIKTGAHRVHPGDIEEAIAEVPGVVEAAVIGIDDALLGQAVMAFVVAPTLAAAPGNTGINAIKAHCRKRLAQYKIPRDVAFVAALPRTASGKVRRAALLDLKTDS